uniref:V-type proton ATPase subunit n=2 Tax=Tetranychus urticae TaxID=32264 RepID=T1KBX9_TETUR
MGASVAVLVIFTAFWAAIGGVVPMFIPRSSDRGVIQTMVIMTAVSCYALWLFTYMAQMNPLIGPQLTGLTQTIVSKNW